MSTAATARREARCCELVDIARQALVDDGLERFVMRDVAARTGMKLGNLQYYFATRADLLEAVFRSEFDRDLAAIRGAVGSSTGHDGDGVLSSVVRGLLRNWTIDGGSSVWSALALLSSHDPRFHRLSQAIYDTFYAELAPVISAVAGAAPPAEVAARARLITSVLDGVAVQMGAALSDDRRRARDLERRALLLVAAIAVGSAGQPAR